MACWCNTYALRDHLGGCSSLGTRFTKLGGMPPSTYRRHAAHETPGMPPCVAKRRRATPADTADQVDSGPLR